MKNIIEKKLQERFSPVFLEVVDNSHLHRGHANSKPEGQTHFLVKIKSAQFLELKTIEIHRLINQTLKQQFLDGVHALEIKIIK